MARRKEIDVEFQKRMAAQNEVLDAAEPKLAVLKNLVKDHPSLGKELEELDDIRFKHCYYDVPKEVYLDKLRHLTGEDYTALYDATYNSARTRNLTGQFISNNATER